MQYLKIQIVILGFMTALFSSGCIPADPVDGDLDEGSYGEEDIRHLVIQEDSAQLVESCRSADIQGALVADEGDLELHFSFFSGLPVQGEEEPIGDFTLQATVLGDTIEGVYFPDDDPSATTPVLMVLGEPGVANTCQ